jgi:hypothetical protein
MQCVWINGQHFTESSDDPNGAGLLADRLTSRERESESEREDGILRLSVRAPPGSQAGLASPKSARTKSQLLE